MDEDLLHSSIKGYLSAVRHLQIVKGPFLCLVASAGVHTMGSQVAAIKIKRYTVKETSANNSGDTTQIKRVLGKGAQQS